MHLHKDGVIFLRDFFLAALALAFVVLVWSGAFAVPFAWLLERSSAACPPPDKTMHRADERRQEAHSLRIFKVVLVVLAALAVADIFLPEPFHLGFDRAASLIVGALVTGFLVIVVGSESWDGRIGWRKWSFWLATFTTAVCVVTVTQALHIRDPRTYLLPIVVAAIVFLWSFGLLRRIDRNNAEMHSLGITREFTGPMPEIPAVEAPKIETNRHKPKRHKKH